MAKYTYDDIPLEEMEALGFDMEECCNDRAFMERFLSGMRSRPVTVNVYDIKKNTIGVKGKIRLAPDYYGKMTVKVQYAQVDFINLKKPFWDHYFNNKQIRRLLKYKELFEPFSIKCNGTEVPGVLGIDTELNILQFTPSDMINVRDTICGLKMENDEKLFIKTGRRVFKKGFLGEDEKTFDAIIFYDSTQDRVRLKTATPELLLDMRNDIEALQAERKESKVEKKEIRKKIPEVIKNVVTHKETDVPVYKKGKGKAYH